MVKWLKVAVIFLFGAPESAAISLPRAIKLYCVHCGHPFTVDPTDHRHGRLTIVRPGRNQKYPPTFYLDLCPHCMLMVEDMETDINVALHKTRFVGIKFGKGSAVHYVWQDENGALYEKYSYGEKLDNT